jgi:hypothetical protein
VLWLSVNLVGCYRRFEEAVCPDLQVFSSQRMLPLTTHTMKYGGSKILRIIPQTHAQNQYIPAQQDGTINV